MVVWHKTCHDCGSVDSMGDACVMRHFMLCDQDRKPPNVSPLQKKFVQHNGITKMLCATWCNLNIFLSFFTLQSRQIYKKKIVVVWTLVAQQLFAWPRHVLYRTTLYKVVWLNCCPCGRTLCRLLMVYFGALGGRHGGGICRVLAASLRCS